VLPLYASENARHTGISAYRLVNTAPILSTLKTLGIPAYRHIGISIGQHCSILSTPLKHSAYRHIGIGISVIMVLSPLCTRPLGTGISAYRHIDVVTLLASTPLKTSAYRHIGISAWVSTLLQPLPCKTLGTGKGISMSHQHCSQPLYASETLGIPAYRHIGISLVNTVPRCHQDCPEPAGISAYRHVSAYR
jgi:hypothetical protein